MTTRLCVECSYPTENVELDRNNGRCDPCDLHSLNLRKVVGRLYRKAWDLAMVGEIDDALEKCSDVGAVPDWARTLATAAHDRIVAKEEARSAGSDDA